MPFFLDRSKWHRPISYFFPSAKPRTSLLRDSELTTRDLDIMRICIALSKEVTNEGEFPFASVIAKDGVIVTEASNRTMRDRDITQHAELLAVSQAQKKLGTIDLSGCSIYSNVEPCPMCSFPVRAAGIGRVLFAIPSPLMGGASRWAILHDCVVSRRMPEAFGDVPMVFAGVLQDEAERVWREWNPLIWAVIRARGVFGGRYHAAPEAQESGSLRLS